ncbi:hypothetical protein GSI01S_10_01570 [Gordonia sihwensis NBRC 108236]|uniref:Oxidoreductase n=2 Tax=Gordoniaceae TaxID=85026 RepID=L7LHI0_9ACTN|nr:hypothetical protein GSI01S_10_01570 [Gordonia sihwensis NBRC 108236]
MYGVDRLLHRLVRDPRSVGADAVVTGAGSGIGRAFALELARRGGDVVCADIDAERAAETVALIAAETGRSAHAVRCDVADRADVEALVTVVCDVFSGAPTLVVNNAGVGIGGEPVGQVGLDDWDWALGINLWGVIHGCELFAPILRAAGRGGIINVASAAGFAAAPSMGPYNVSKAGVMSLSETLAAELAGSGVGVTVLCPTFVKTNVARDGRITEAGQNLAGRLMELTGTSPQSVAAMTLDAHDLGRLYVLPQLDANVIWRLKRFLPVPYARGLGVLGRFLPAAWATVSSHPTKGPAMAMDFDSMLQKIKDRQWALADIDWDAPGAELIEPELHAKLKPFISDLMWIENVGARGFAAMAKKAPDATLKSIYEHFHAEEQKHANAELALMRRWGMLDDDEIPSPNVNVQLVINWLDRYSDGLSLSFLGTVIPMLEVALDGALIKFITDEVKDPVAQEVFKRINSDESRHLAVDFEVMDMLGHASLRRRTIDFVGGWAQPSLLVGLLTYLPLLNKMRDNIVAMGVDEQRLYSAMKRYRSVGRRSEYTRRLPMFRFVATHGALVTNRDNVAYHAVADSLVTVTNWIPVSLVRRTPTWSRELTYEPTA